MREHKGYREKRATRQMLNRSFFEKTSSGAISIAQVAGHRTWSRGVTAPTARSVAAALVFSLSERTLQTTSPYLITSSSARVRQSCRRPSIRQRFVLDQGSTPRKIFSHISCCASVGPMVCPDGALLCDKKSRKGLRTRDFSIFLQNVS